MQRWPAIPLATLAPGDYRQKRRADEHLQPAAAERVVISGRPRARRFPLRRHLVALVIIAVVPVLLFAGTIAVDLAREQRVSVERGLRTSVRALATAVEREIGASVQSLEVLATSPLLTSGDLGAFHAQAREVEQAYDRWYVIALTSPDGRILLSTSRPFGTPLPSIRDREYFARLLATGEPTVSDLVVGRTTGTLNVTVAVPVRRDGVLRYVLFAAIDPETFGRILAAQQIPADWIATVADTRQVLIARNRDPERFVGRELIEPIRRAARAAPHGSGRYPVYDSPDVYAAWQRIPSLGWTVTLGTPVALVDAPLRQSLLMLGAAGLIVTLVGGGIAALWGRRISGAMATLAAAAGEVGRGGVPAHRPSSIDEVDAVGRALEAAGKTIANQTAALVASQTRIRRLVESNLIGIVFGEGWSIVDANDAFLRMVGESRENLSRRVLRWRGVTAPGCRSDGDAPVTHAQDEWPAYEDEYVRADGSLMPILVGGARLEPAGSQWVAFVVDLTERKRAEDERRLRIEAEAANRAKDEFLAMLSHELRTPLTAILAWTRMLKTGRLREQPEAEALERIERSTRLQARLIDDLLDVSRIVAGKLTIDRRLVEMPGVVRDAVAAVEQEAEARGIRLRAAVDSGNGAVLGDAERLQQVVINLLGNAIKFTPPGGDVEVAVAGDGARVVLTVRDTGQGIERDLLPHVFDRFRQGSGTTDSRSLGLGLAIVRHLVELHDGTVRAESRGPGRGATFTVELPAFTVSPTAVTAPS